MAVLTSDHARNLIIMTVIEIVMIMTVIAAVATPLIRIGVGTGTKTKVVEITESTEVTGMRRGEAGMKSQENHQSPIRKSKMQMRCGQSWALLHLNFESLVMT